MYLKNSSDPGIREVYTRVFYNSNYLGQKMCHLFPKENQNLDHNRYVHSMVNDSKGVTEHYRPAGGHQGHNFKVWAGKTKGNVHGTGSAYNSVKVEEVSPSPAQQTIVKCTK